MVSFKRRNFLLEAMDRPDCNSETLVRTLRHFRIVNLLFSRSRYLLRKFIIRDMADGPQNSYTMLDLGAGDGDLSRWLVRAAHRITNRRIRAVCLDKDPRAVTHMEAVFGTDPHLEVRRGAAERIEELGSFDYVFANHFLHHLKDEHIAPMIARICRSTRRLFLINDLRRSRIAYVAYTLFAGLFLWGSYALEDGRLSIRKGFLPSELASLTRAEGWDIRVLTVFPGRVCIVGRPTPPSIIK